MSNIQTGIYFLIKDGIIIYIGQSTRITKRIRDHKRDKDFDHYRVIACDESLLLQYEKRLIKYFKPRLNGVTGGKREGAGRTKGSFVNVQKKEPTKVIRVPVSKLEAVKELIKKKHCPRCLSEDVIMFTSDLDLCRCCGHTFL